MPRVIVSRTAVNSTDVFLSLIYLFFKYKFPFGKKVRTHLRAGKISVDLITQNTFLLTCYTNRNLLVDIYRSPAQCCLCSREVERASATPFLYPLYIPLWLHIAKMHRADCNAIIISLLKAFL